ncbi:MAG: M23 family metallopeptidase [Alphaproteobacteria bacterium]
MGVRRPGPEGTVRGLGTAVFFVVMVAILAGVSGKAHAARGKLERTHLETPAPAAAKAESPKEPTPKEEAATAEMVPVDGDGKRLVLERGENIFTLLRRQGIASEDITAATQAVSEAYDIRRIQPGDAVVVQRGHGGRRASELRLMALRLEVPDVRGLSVVRGADGRFGRPAVGRVTSARLYRRTLEVHSDLKKTLGHTSLPSSVSRDVLRAVRLDRSFRSKPSKGSRLTVVYEVSHKPAGGEPTLRYASLQSGGRQHRLYRYPLASSEVAYLNEQGQGVAVVELDTPIGTRPEVSSGWGWRVHPVLGRKKFHKGVDFRAPRGTPALAAADGVVDDIGWRGNYGLYVRIRHGAGLSTAYAHLDRFAASLHKGTTVTKGQPVGYVGTTGLATGPHLYYEVLVGNRRVNPMKNDGLAVPVKLQDGDLAKFKRYVQSTDHVVGD